MNIKLCTDCGFKGTDEMFISGNVIKCPECKSSDITFTHPYDCKCLVCK
ncbi:hypothetical protein GQ473_06120 [archaeon]|nr:hypothetical protein [archaeon]